MDTGAAVFDKLNTGTGGFPLVVVATAHWKDTSGETESGHVTLINEQSVPTLRKNCPLCLCNPRA